MKVEKKGFWEIINIICGAIIIVTIISEFFGFGKFDLSRIFFVFLISTVLVETKRMRDYIDKKFAESEESE